MGIIKHTVNVSHQMLMVQQNINPMAEVDKTCELILMLLPSDTKFRGVMEMTSVSMAMPFLATFEHPAMPDCEIVFNYVRRAWLANTGNERIKQASVAIGFDFILPDGTKWDGTDINKTTLAPVNGISLIEET